jgi:hypothetical protein
MIHGRELLKKKQNLLKDFNALMRELSKRRCIIGTDFWGPRLSLLEKSSQMILARYRQT